MAIDTRQKRQSSYKILAPYMEQGVHPSGAIGQAQRQAAAWIYSGILAETAGVTLSVLKALVKDIGSGLGLPLSSVGNLLPVSITTTAPSGAPPGGKGIVFEVSGGTLKIHAWDGSQWVQNT